MRIAFAKGKENTNFFSKEDFFVNNVGYYKNIKTDITCHRPFGRNDYQLIVIIKGEMIINNKKMLSNNAYLYAPNKEQNYTFKGVRDCEYYWIHFSGTKVEKFLEKLNIFCGNIKLNNKANRVINLIEDIFTAYQMQLEYVDDYAKGLLTSLLALIASPILIPPPFFKAIKVLSDVTSDYTIKEIAQECNMSEGHFIREFKNAIGLSPLSYRLSNKIKIAKDLLCGTYLSINQISSACGFEDAMYFSRIFKRREGISPMQFRKTYQNKSDN